MPGSISGFNGTSTLGAFKEFVFARATGATLLSTSYREVVTNEGASSKPTYTITAATGAVFEFIVQDADGLRVTAASGDTIRVIDKVTATGGYVESTTIGSTIRLIAINATDFIAVSVNGVWTDGKFTYDDTSLTTP